MRRQQLILTVHHIDDDEGSGIASTLVNYDSAYFLTVSEALDEFGEDMLEQLKEQFTFKT